MSDGDFPQDTPADTPQDTPADTPAGIDGREAAALAELDHRGRRAAAALRDAARARVLAERARSNGAGAPADATADPGGTSGESSGDGRAPVVAVSSGPEPGRRPARRPLWLAAAAVVLVAVAGALVVARSDGRDPVAMSDPGRAYLVPGWLPDGWQARHPILPEPFAMMDGEQAVYGDGNAEDPWAGPLLEITHFTDEPGTDEPGGEEPDEPDGPASEGEPVTIDGRDGVLVQDEHSDRLVATTGGLTVSGERGATREQVMAAAEHASDHPAIAPAGLPEGYEELARGGLDGAAGTIDGVESGVVVSYGEGPQDAFDEPRIALLQRPGDAEAVDLAHMLTEAAEPTTVRGHHAVIAATAEGVHLQWVEPPGVLVTLSASPPVSEEDVRRFAEELRPAQPDERDDLIADHGVEDGAPTWDYEGIEEPTGGDASGATTADQERYRAECAAGSMTACDRLWTMTPVGSELEAFAETCGGRDPDGGHQATCDQEFGDGAGGTGEPSGGDSSGGPDGPGATTADQERYRAECAAGSMTACDRLWAVTPVGSELEAFAETCGGRDPDGGHQATCDQEFGPDS